jgi:hypothetical protein
VLKHLITVAVEMLGEPDSVGRGQEPVELVAPIFKPVAPDVGAVDGQDVERVPYGRPPYSLN